MSLYTLKSAKLFLFNCLIALFFTSVQTLNAISLIAWHPVIGEDFATSGSFITKVSCDDATYSTFSIFADGDGALFDIQNSDELIVKTGSNLTSGSYTLKLGVSNGSLTYHSTFTTVSGKAHVLRRGLRASYFFLKKQVALYFSR